jgi:hypothetical protein
MSIRLPNIRPNLRAFPGTAPAINVSHPAYNKLRVAGVAIGSGVVNLANNRPATLGGATVVSTTAGPGVAGASGAPVAYQNFVTETTATVTLSAIFVYTTLSATRIIFGGSGIQLASLGPSNVQIIVSGVGIALTPTLPTLVNGHTYFFAASSNTSAPRISVVLADLTTGALFTATGTTAINAVLTPSTPFTGLQSFNSRINAQSWSSAPLTLQQLLQWAQNPWSLWYDRSTSNLARLARKTSATVVPTVSAALATTEAVDVAHFVVSNPTVSAALAATEANDVAHFVVENAPNISTTLATTEAKDVAHFVTSSGTNITAALATTEARDVAHFVANNFKPVTPSVGGNVPQRMMQPHPRAFPGGHPKLNLAHPAYNQGIRLAMVPLGQGTINLVNMTQGDLSGIAIGGVTSSQIGPAISVATDKTNIGVLYKPLIPAEQFGNTVTLAAIFVANTEGGQKALVSPTQSAVSCALCVVTPTTPEFQLNGGPVTLTPPLPSSLTVGHSYFFAASLRTTAPRVAVVLADLTTGQVFTSTGTIGTINITVPPVGYGSPATVLNSRLAASYISQTALTMEQLTQWAQDPWSLWYDPAAQSVAALARRGRVIPVGPITAALATTEARDVANFNITNSSSHVFTALATTEAADVARFATSGPAAIFTGLPSAADYVLAGAGFSPPAPIVGSALRTYARVLQPDGVTLKWIEVTTDTFGFNDWVYVTALIQEIKLNLGESPFWANRGIPAFPSVVQQIAPDYYMTLIQQRYAPFFLNLTIARITPNPNDRLDEVVRPAPTYQINITTHSGVQRAITV